MYSTGEFEGSFQIDGKSEDTRVSVSLDESLHLSPARRGMSASRVGLLPVTPSMLLTRDPALMAQGLHYEVRGNALGSVAVGSAADGYELHAVVAFELGIHYSAAGIRVEITGQTLHHGRDVSSPAPWPPEPRAFAIHFDIPRDGLGAFFQLKDEWLSQVQALFDQCFDPAA